MTSRLACADITVMAGQAVAGICVRMVKRRTSKGYGVMADGAILVIGGGRYVVRQFTDTDHIVVARVAATDKRRACMTKDASAKSTRSMANTTILIGIHVSIERGAKRFTACFPNKTSMAAGCRAIIYDAGMIDDCVSKTLGVMAQSAI